MKLRMSLVAAVLLAAAVGWSAIGREQAPPAAAPAADDSPGTSRAAYAKAFNAGDAKAVAALFTKDAEMTGIDGVTIRGQAAIEAEYADLFKTNPGLTITVEVGTTKPLGESLVTIDGVSKIRKPGSTLEDVTIFTALLVKDAGAWKVASVTEYEPDDDTGNLKDLGWLVGTWSGSSGGTTMTATYAWDEAKTFLQCKYEVIKDGKSLAKGMQMIGEDAEGVRAWLFDASGTTGDSRWTKDGERWTIQAAGQLPGGGESVSTQLIVKVNDNVMTWQSIDRVVNGAALPDGPPMKLTRQTK